MARSSPAPPPVRGVRVGHAESRGRTSGVTAVLFDRPVATVVDHRGGASGTYDIASLSLDATFGFRWGLFFTGGSLFGLDAAAGIRRRVLESGGGVSPFGNPNRVVPLSGACLFDLPLTVESLPDYRALGYRAARAAHVGPVPVGRVGAGAGASVGKYLGRTRSMAGGIGWASLPLGRGRVGVLTAVNAVGAVRDPSTGRWEAGARGADGEVVPPTALAGRSGRGSNTTLSLILTDLGVERSALQRAAAIAHAAMGGVVVPFQTSTDGDVMFAAATGVAGRPPRERRPGEIADELGARAAACAVEATLVAVRAANPKG